MSGLPSGPATVRAGANADDLDSVLGRFQEWTKARGEQPGAKFSSTASLGRAKASKQVNLTHGARELSYEQALRASSYRRPVLSPVNEATAPAVESFQTTVAEVRKPNVDLDARRESASEPVRHVGLRSSKAPSPEVSDTARTLRVKGPAATAPEPRKKTRRNTEKSQAVSEKSVRPANSGRIPGPPIVPLMVNPQPVFREVLREAAGLAAPTRSASIPEANLLVSKTVAISLRVSDAEQARIQAGAARANLSVSAYLRQCALGVDELRAQVELALSGLHKQETRPQAAPGMKDIPGIFVRFAARCFRKLRGRHDFTGLSLR